MRNQFSENCIVQSSLVELPEEAKIAVVEQAKIVYAIAQHRQAFQSAAKREAQVTFRVEAEIAHDVGMHLACA